MRLDVKRCQGCNTLVKLPLKLCEPCFGKQRRGAVAQAQAKRAALAPKHKPIPWVPVGFHPDSCPHWAWYVPSEARCRGCGLSAQQLIARGDATEARLGSDAARLAPPARNWERAVWRGA